MHPKNQSISTCGSKKNTPKVSVCVVTYNQERYISECLQSIIDQETDFDFEVIVSDDCSTDNTKKIIREFENLYPTKIQAIIREKNLGAVKNIIDCYKRAKGKYIAHLDGDDTALPGKLQKQYNALEYNDNCTICSHNVKIIDKNSNTLRENFNNIKSGIYNINYLIYNLPFFAHSSKMFRSPNDHKWLDELHPESIDIELHVNQAKNGNIIHINEVLGEYRAMTGVSSVTQGVNSLLIKGNNRIFTSLYKENINDKEKFFIKKCHAKSIMKYAYQALISGNENQFKELIRESISIKKISATQFLMYAASFNLSLANKIVKHRHRSRYGN